jgi:hypothetical protein
MSVLSNVNNNDGIIAPMGVDELIQKLSRLNKNSTKSDLEAIFGKSPYDMAEANSYIYTYYSGDIIIRLWGDPLFQVIVTYKESNIAINLN